MSAARENCISALVAGLEFLSDPECLKRLLESEQPYFNLKILVSTPNMAAEVAEVLEELIDCMETETA